MSLSNHSSRLAIVGVSVAIGAAALAYVQAGKTLRINGAPVSSRVIEVKGVAYVPIHDVAKHLKMSTSKSAKGYELKPVGGTNMVEGLRGKVGQELFNGFARFTVVEVIRTKKYINRFSGDRQEVTPFPEQNDLVVVVCRLKNGVRESVTFGLPGGQLSGLTDMNARAYAFRSGLSIDCPTRGAQLLPGSAVDFALTFDVPADAELKDFVYEVQDLGGKHTAAPFRIAVGK